MPQLLSDGLHIIIPIRESFWLGGFMSVAEQILQHVSSLPEAAQSEVLDFVEYLESKSDRNNWSEFSLTQAMRGMESEKEFYSLKDIKA